MIYSTLVAFAGRCLRFAPTLNPKRRGTTRFRKLEEHHETRSCRSQRIRRSCGVDLQHGVTVNLSGWSVPVPAGDLRCAGRAILVNQAILRISKYLLSIPLNRSIPPRASSLCAIPRGEWAQAGPWEPQFLGINSHSPLILGSGTMRLRGIRIPATHRLASPRGDLIYTSQRVWHGRSSDVSDTVASCGRSSCRQLCARRVHLSY